MDSLVKDLDAAPQRLIRTYVLEYTTRTQFVAAAAVVVIIPSESILLRYQEAR